jgi:hypothetical protein
MPRVLATILLRGTIPVEWDIIDIILNGQRIQMNTKGKDGGGELFADFFFKRK